MSRLDRAETESYDGDEALEDARDPLGAADDRQVRRRRGIDPERFPQIRAGPPARRLGIETMASGSTVASSVVEGIPAPIRGAGVALTRSSWAGFPSRASLPLPPEPGPNPYELEAEEYLRTLLECEEEMASSQAQAAEANRSRWISEEQTTARTLAFRHEIRCLEDRAHALQKNLELSETMEIAVRREAMERGTHLEVALTHNFDMFVILFRMRQRCMKNV